MAKEQSKILASRFREVILNGTWIANTNYSKLLSDITVEEANQKVSSLNTIALLTCHINYYIAGVLQVLHGGSLDIRDKYSFDMPEVTSAEQWNQLKEALFDNANSFADAVEKLSDKQLQAGFVKEEYGSYSRNIEGMIEHCYYHMGQISIIKKMIRKL